MQEFRSTFDLDDDDELWLVVDKDRWTDAMLRDVAQQCFVSRVNLALSNPCFEVWLALHYLEDLPELKTSKDVERLFAKLHGGYSKAKLKADGLLSLVDKAIQNAQRLDKNPLERWPNAHGSRVYLLAQSILKS